MLNRTHFIAIAVLGMFAFAAAASAQTGPVATACKEDIAKYCADKEHGQGDVRACLVANKDKVSDVCKQALDNTGPGSGPRSQGN
jgi:hypothetical protein